MVRIYYTDCNYQLSNSVFLNYLISLPPEMRNHINKFRRWQDAQTSLFGKLLLRKGLNDLGLESKLDNLKYSKFGKPFLIDSLDFNITHSSYYTVCAFSTDGKIGADIEVVNPIIIDHFKNQFLIEEWDAIMNSKDTYYSFYYYWTAKEAIIKAEGRGLSVPLNSVLIKDGKTILEKKDWYYTDMKLYDECVFHIASNKKLIDIQTYKVDINNLNTF